MAHCLGWDLFRIDCRTSFSVLIQSFSLSYNNRIKNIRWGYLSLPKLSNWEFGLFITTVGVAPNAKEHFIYQFVQILLSNIVWNTTKCSETWNSHWGTFQLFQHYERDNEQDIHDVCNCAKKLKIHGCRRTVLNLNGARNIWKIPGLHLPAVRRAPDVKHRRLRVHQRRQLANWMGIVRLQNLEWMPYFLHRSFTTV